MITHFDNVENDIIDFQPEAQQQQYAVFRKIHSKKDILRNLISVRHYKGAVIIRRMKCYSRCSHIFTAIKLWLIPFHFN